MVSGRKVFKEVFVIKLVEFVGWFNFYIVIYYLDNGKVVVFVDYFLEWKLYCKIVVLVFRIYNIGVLKEGFNISDEFDLFLKWVCLRNG